MEFLSQIILGKVGNNVFKRIILWIYNYYNILYNYYNILYN
jgi:hypothetical protein